MNEPLTVGSVCSGVGGIDLGLERAGMRVVFQCEADEWCRGILAQHWPGVPCYHDVRLVHAPRRGPGGGGEDAIGRRGGQRAPARPGAGSDGGRVVHALDGAPSVDLLCGGTPCQDLSVAGLRAGLAGSRSGLFFEFARCADELVRPGGWLLFENVPGLLNSQGGRDFAIVVRTLGDIGFHDLAWRVLDSRYLGVPQRRRRVFIVGRRAVGDGARSVLLEPESGGGNFAPGREKGPRVAASLSRGSSGPGVSAPGRRQEDDENIVNAFDTQRGGADDNSAQAGHLIAPALVKRYAKGTDSDATDCLIAHTLRAEGFDASEDGTGRGTPLVSASPHPDGMRATPVVPRRVDDPRPDGPRYAAMGNAVTVNVSEWIGRRIVAYERGSVAA